MALATQCPHCGTMFRVASDQLKLRGGIVRCGACQEIFDGSATLVDLDKLPARGAAAAPPAPAPPSASSAVSPADSPADSPAASPADSPSAAAPTAPAVPPSTSLSDSTPAQADAAPDEELPFTIVAGDDEASSSDASAHAPDAAPEDQPVYTLDFDHTFDPLGILPKVAAPEGEAQAGTGAEPTGTDAQPARPADADGEIDALDLLQPWSRPSEPHPAPQPVAVAAVPAEVAPPDAAPPDAALPDARLPATERAAGEAAAPAAAVALEPQAEEALQAPPAAPAARARVPDSAGRYEPAFGLPVDEELVAAPLPDHEPEPRLEPVAAAPQPARTRPRTDDAPPLLTRESAASVVTPPAPPVTGPLPAARTPAARRAEKAAARRSKLVPTKIEPAPKLRAAEIDEPEFVKRSRQQEQSGRTRRIAMLAGSIALLLVLVAQGMVTFRNALAARFPAAKPALVSGCALLGCRVELPAQVDHLTIETGELTTLGGGAYSFTTELRNTGATAQAWPSLELALTDADEKPLVRRVFAPTDYLAAGTPLANGMAPGAEQAIKLHFRVDDLKPSGYHIAVFYP